MAEVLYPRRAGRGVNASQLDNGITFLMQVIPDLFDGFFLLICAL